MSKKITLATVKSFIRKSNNLHIKFLSSFDGMVDCVMPSEQNDFSPTLPSDRHHENTLGIHGAWFTHGRNWFESYECERFKGIKVSNCCGSFILATPK